MLEDALEHLVRGIVDHPDDVVVRVRASRGNREGKFNREVKTFEVKVNPEDLGRVIGRNGRTATALRTVLAALQPGRGVRIDFLDTHEN
ncbi:MAG: hypothetical protein RLZZ426_1169 [Actinomycetota bacterium]|jgi:hypothetical protein